MEPPSQLRISFQNRTSQAISTQPLRVAIRIALQMNHLSAGTVSVLLTLDEEQRKLNQTFRAIDSSTDVLTFPSQSIPGQKLKHLGDISISIEYAQRQAAARCVPIENELVMLAIHGALHLVGLDDETEPDRLAMLQEMDRVASELHMTGGKDWHTMPNEDFLVEAQ